MVGGCSFMLHVRHAAAAINEGLCNTVLITHGESGRSRVGVGAFAGNRASLEGQFEVPFGIAGPTSTFTIPVLRYMKNYGVSEEQLAMVAVVQREWAAKNPRATMKDPITVDDVLELAHDRIPISPDDVLPGDRRRRRADPDLGRAREGLSAQARIYPRHREKAPSPG